MPKSLLLSAACALLFAGCSFDSTGIGPKPQLPNDSAPPDVVVVRFDASPDAGVLCAEGATGPTCRFAGDEVGESGSCSEGAFAPDHACFADAPCINGVCTKNKSDCTPNCVSTSDCNGGVCTALFVPGSSLVFEMCCAGESSNGDGTFRTPCSTGAACHSGLCTDKGFCYEACGGFWPTCDGGTCELVTIRIAGSLTDKKRGCVATTADAGADSAPGDASSSDALPD